MESPGYSNVIVSNHDLMYMLPKTNSSPCAIEADSILAALKIIRYTFTYAPKLGSGRQAVVENISGHKIPSDIIALMNDPHTGDDMVIDEMFSSSGPIRGSFVLKFTAAPASKSPKWQRRK